MEELIRKSHIYFTRDLINRIKHNRNTAVRKVGMRTPKMFPYCTQNILLKILSTLFMTLFTTITNLTQFFWFIVLSVRYAHYDGSEYLQCIRNTIEIVTLLDTVGIAVQRKCNKVRYQRTLENI
uniref:Uncharacterized protein n=1 Tax=Glossina pallidipes TaxID=7398 RepID=A0A1B0ABF3_GLOPL